MTETASISYNSNKFFAKQKDFVLIIPTWNEGENLVKQIKDLQNFTNLVDIVIVDYKSDDGSTEHNFLKENNISTLIDCHEKGLASALRAGFDFVKKENYQWIITIDSNGKDGVDALEAVINKLQDGFDFVQASRFKKGGHHENTPFLRLLGIFLFIVPAIGLSSGYWYSDPTNGFKGFSSDFLYDNRVQPLRSIFQKFNLQYYLNYMAAKLNFKVTEVPAKRVYPNNGDVPTKIHGLQSHFEIIWEVLKTVFGLYCPKDKVN